MDSYFLEEDKMKRKIYLVSFIIVSLFAILLTYCGEEKIEWNCSCTVQCDDNSQTFTGTECQTKSDLQKAMDKTLSDCNNKYSSECSSYKCECKCDPTDTSC